MSYLATGFTSDEEKELLVMARGDAAKTAKLDEVNAILREQEKLKLVSTIAAIGGALYALARLGELIGSFRDRRKHIHL